MLVTGVGPGLEMIDFETIVENDYINDIKLPWEDARLKIVLTGRIPYIAAKKAREIALKLLDRNNLKVEDIVQFLVHSGGARILDQFEEVMGLSHDELKYSWETWREVGNLSSSTITISVMKMIESNTLKQNDKILLIGLGAGFQACAILTQWVDS